MTDGDGPVQEVAPAQARSKTRAAFHGDGRRTRPAGSCICGVCLNRISDGCPNITPDALYCDECESDLHVGDRELPSG